MHCQAQSLFRPVLFIQKHLQYKNDMSIMPSKCSANVVVFLQCVYSLVVEKINYSTLFPDI